VTMKDPIDLWMDSLRELSPGCSRQRYLFVEPLIWPWMGAPNRWMIKDVTPDTYNRHRVRDLTGRCSASPLGALCSVFLLHAPYRRRRAKLVRSRDRTHLKFTWRFFGKRRSCSKAWEIPMPVREWWDKHHPDLPLSHVRPMFRDRGLPLDMLVDMLEVRAPWSMDTGLLGYSPGKGANGKK